MSVRVPVRDMVVLPLRAITTPVPAATVVSGRPVVPVPYSSSDPEGGRGFNDNGGLRMVPFASLMKIAAADLGNGFGTAIGSVPFAEVSCRSETRACALIFATSPPKYHGRSVSVALMSTYFAVHGEPFGSVLSP